MFHQAPELSIEFARLVAPFRPLFIEEPCKVGSVDVLREISEKSPVPIATGEKLFSYRSFKEVIDKRAQKVKAKDLKFRVNTAKVQSYLGPPKFRSSRAEDVNEVGVTNGLAVTMAGGDLLTTEVSLMPGTGQLKLTGNLAKVMEESAHAALSYVRSKAWLWGLAPDFHKRVDIHIHFPEGAIPKDGPSAGITMATSLVSALTRIPVKKDVAMTGEITLRGRVLPIGGLKQKVLAAHRAGVKLVVIPEENRKDFEELEDSVKHGITSFFVKTFEDVLRIAFKSA